ncbi:MAG: dipeptide/oligopeptide/nickel ABC transporter ATP-binding protein [Firmicutes bacterium]|nr:dipeptide/oligopeptide/nickel ABC transporter ATP-binding protein [Bacillota bacterium]
MLNVENLFKQYIFRDPQGRKAVVKAVDNVSFSLEENQSYSLVGESGSGKSTLARLLMYLEKPTSGVIKIDGVNLAQMSKRELRNKRARWQMVMQDGQSSLDPKVKIYDSIAEPMRNFYKMTKNEEKQRIETLTNMVELPPEILGRLPHELSGGQQKRVSIARAISVKPRFIIFDEAVSGLDVTVRKKILDLLLRLRDEIRSAYLFITHDIDVALYMARNIMVMKDGRILERIENISTLEEFKHDYSKLLINSLPPRTPEYRQALL